MIKKTHHGETKLQVHDPFDLDDEEEEFQEEEVQPQDLSLKTSLGYSDTLLFKSLVLREKLSSVRHLSLLSRIFASQEFVFSSDWQGELALAVVAVDDAQLVEFYTSDLHPRVRHEVKSSLRKRLRSSPTSAAWLRLPDARLASDGLLDYVSPQRRLAYYLAHLSLPESSNVSSYIEGLLTVLKNGADLWWSVPDDILAHHNIYSFAPEQRRLLFHANQMDDPSRLDRPAHIAYVAAALGSMDVSAQNDFIERVPNSALRDVSVFKSLKPAVMVRTVWDELLSGDAGAWESLPPAAKIFCVYRAVKESIMLVLPDPRQEAEQLVRAVLTLYRTTSDQGAKASLFNEAHKTIEEWVCSQAWRSTRPLMLSPLLPNCGPGIVKYCEGQARAKRQLSEVAQEGDPTPSAWCPRAASMCLPMGSAPRVKYRSYEPWTRSRRGRRSRRDYDFDQPTEYMLTGARVSADLKQNWDRWRLLELLVALGITPRLDGLSDVGGAITLAAAYTLKLSGWVNRLNDLRPRLACRVCGEIMVPDYGYARFLARYNVTVAECRHGLPHDKVYLNHCWACEKIIDSRDSTIKVSDEGQVGRGLHLCLVCGSGPMSHGPSHGPFAQGDVCPKCGKRAMRLLADGQVRKCDSDSCGHRISLPIKHNITGPRCPICGDPTYDTGERQRFCVTCYDNAQHDADAL